MRTDVVVIGAGPIGLEVASVLKRNRVSYLHFEAGQIGETIARWPRNTVFFSSPEWIAVAGIPIHTVGQQRITGERYLAYLRHVCEVLDMKVRTYERVTSISGEDGSFAVRTSSIAGEREYQAAKIILAVGDMDRPRLLGIPGEHLPTVTHYFDDPHRYFGKRLLIVGGRNSAMEAALRCWRSGVDVTVSYRREAIEERRVLSRIYLEISILFEKGQLGFLPSTVPVSIEPGAVDLEATDGSGRKIRHETDFVYLATGFVQDDRLYRSVGVSLIGAEERPEHDPETMETNVPGVYVAGTGVGGNQSSYTVFITTCHDHSYKILRSLDRGETAITGNLPARDYELTPEDIE
jgi:thioredoxin reductase (NADPH)